MSNDNRKIKSIFWPDSGSETGRCMFSNQNGAGQLAMREEFRGDHDEDWIVETIDGKEISRHNARYVETIIWEESDV